MAKKTFAQVKAIEQKNKQRLLKINPQLNERSGIYFLLRTDEEGFKFGYIGQAKHILTRLSQHLVGYQHIDLSLKKHGLYHETNNPYGWKVNFLNCPESELDEKEQLYIKQYALAGYQLRNKTSGSQGEGKKQIDEYRPAKGYRDGLAQGRKNASKEIAHLFEKHLDYKPKSDPPTKNQQKAMDKFEAFMDEHRMPNNNGALNIEEIERNKYGRTVVSSGSE